MKVVIMQPYIFPYIGYFQLVKEADVFVFYDDVSFIKRGWVNRNKILVGGKEFLFSIPLQKASQNDLINETLINKEVYSKWLPKFLKTLKLSYKKAPFFEPVFDLIESTLKDNQGNTISDLACKSIKTTTDYLGLSCKFQTSSALKNQHQEKGKAERLIHITKDLNGIDYINPIGGKELYTKDEFRAYGVNLLFLHPHKTPYKQFSKDFVPWLSIIDVLMFNSKEEARALIADYELE